MQAKLSGIEELSVKIDNQSSISAKLNLSNSLSARISDRNQMSATIHDDDLYDSNYDIEMGFDDIVMNTKNKFLTDDIVIKKVPISTTSNESGGYTLNIGG